MQIFLVRHGLPERMEVTEGVTDPPLASLGLRPALRGDLPDFLDLDAFRGRVTDALEQVMATP
jgi:hypothetical protein